MLFSSADAPTRAEHGSDRTKLRKQFVEWKAKARRRGDTHDHQREAVDAPILIRADKWTRWVHVRQFMELAMEPVTELAMAQVTEPAMAPAMAQVMEPETAQMMEQAMEPETEPEMEPETAQVMALVTKKISSHPLGL